jgi:pimeloyl-ACP methyl ester carboxylesterase
MPFRPPVVISVHGIRTHGLWQKILSEVLSDEQIPTRSFDYGYFNSFQFVTPSARRKKITAFRDWYGALMKEKRLRHDNPRKRPSVIAHSFGTYIVGYCMQMFPEVCFDKVILCGSILPTDFNWATIFSRGQVNHVRNEKGWKDFWVGSAHHVSRTMGPSGKTGFDVLPANWLEQVSYEYGHDGNFYRQHMQANWIPYLRRPPIDLTIRHGHEFNDLAVFEQTLNASVAIDDACFGALPAYDLAQLPRGLSLKWISINPDIYTFLIDQVSGAVKGYINAMPVTDAMLDRIKAGQIRDNEITENDVRAFVPNTSLSIYFMSVAIAAGVRRAGEGLYSAPFEKLLYAFLSKLEHVVTEKNVHIREIVAVGWTAEGTQLCEMFGMEKIGLDRDRRPLFRLDLQQVERTPNTNAYRILRPVIEAQRRASAARRVSPAAGSDPTAPHSPRA